VSSKSIIKHITPVGGNVFADLGFPPEEAAALKAESDRIISESLARKAADARMQADALFVSGVPEGRVPDYLEADDND